MFILRHHSAEAGSGRREKPDGAANHVPVRKPDLTPPDAPLTCVHVSTFDSQNRLTSDASPFPYTVDAPLIHPRLAP